MGNGGSGMPELRAWLKGEKIRSAATAAADGRASSAGSPKPCVISSGSDLIRTY